MGPWGPFTECYVPPTQEQKQVDAKAREQQTADQKEKKEEAEAPARY